MNPVKLPREVLNLFPMWEYRCPRCNTYVESGKSFCPNCKMPFDKKKWRLPPRFLKSHEAMSKYAHKVLAPKLPPEQRELLFKYFTILFQHGFEGGDFGEDPQTGYSWDGQNVNGPTLSVENTPAIAYHGDHYMKVAGLTASNWGFEYKDITPTDNVYTRFYLRFEDLPSVGGKVISGIVRTGNKWLCFALINTGTNKWGLLNYVTFTSYWESGTSTITAGIWYCIEFRCVAHSSNGILQMWVDGVQKVNETGLDTSSDNIIQVDIGAYGTPTTETSTKDYYYDCVVVADTYIGPETTGQTYTKTWTTDVLFRKFGILKTFGIDSDFFKKDVIKSFAVDVRFSALATRTISRQIDVLLKKLDMSKTFDLDVYFGAVVAETYGKTFGLDAIFAYKVRLPELWLDENGKIVLNLSKPFTWVGS